MSKPTLRLLALVLTIGIVIVLFAGLDNLPRQLRSQIDAERAAMASAQKQLSAAQNEVARDLKAEAVLFQAIPSSRQYDERFGKDSGVLRSAAAKLQELSQ